MQKGFLLSLMVGVVLSLSSTSAQLISHGQASPDQIVPHGMPMNKSAGAFEAAARQGLLVASGQPGDLDGDGDVDNDDLNRLLAELNTPVSGSTCGVRCDLNGDAVINALDARQLVALCTRPRCATA